MRNLDKLSIGIFGGSFNPAHDGHMHVASCGLRELALDRIWWITSKQNPLKNKQTEYNKRVNSIKSLGPKGLYTINTFIILSLFIFKGVLFAGYPPYPIKC